MMGMSTHVVGFKPPDEKWRAMKKVWEACSCAGIEIPDDVENFFNGQEPDEAGVEIDLDESHGVEEWSDDMQEGFEIHIDKLPKDVKIVRVFNSW